MKQIIQVSLLALTLTAFTGHVVLAQSEAAQPAAISKKTITLSGIVGTGGKTLVTNGNRVWTVANPGVLAATEGRAVTVRGHLSANASEIVVSIVRLRDERTTPKLDDAAFRR